MLHKQIKILGRSLILRLLAWYSLAMLILFSIIFTLLFFNAKQTLYSNASRRLGSEIAELVSAYNSEGMQELDKVIARTAYTHGIGEVCYSVLDPNGNILLTSDMSQWAGLPLQSQVIVQTLHQKQPIISNVDVEGIDASVLIAYTRLANGKILRAATVLRYTDAFLADLQTQLVITAMTVMIAVMIVGAITLHFIINRVTDVTQTALAIPGTSMSERVPVIGNGDEIDKLANAFNGMLDRIELLIKGLNEVTENVAHDLKSPLTRIRVIAESLMKKHAADDLSNQIAADIMEESDRLLEMINTMLRIKAMDVGMATRNFTVVDITDVVRQACEIFEIIAQEKGVSFTMLLNGSLPVSGDLRLLQRAFSNLIDNAVKYTDAGGKVDVQILSEPDTVKVVVADTGAGIDPESLGRIFERFYRADRSRRVPGLGLGLSLAESIIKAHGGRIAVESIVAKGSRFIISLPKKSLVK